MGVSDPGAHKVKVERSSKSVRKSPGGSNIHMHNTSGPHTGMRVWTPLETTGCNKAKDKLSWEKIFQSACLHVFLYRVEWVGGYELTMI